MEKSITMTMNTVTGEVNYTVDDMNYFEVLGLIENVKLMITEKYINEPE